MCEQAEQQGCKCGPCDDAPICWCSDAYKACPADFIACEAKAEPTQPEKKPGEQGGADG